MSRFFVMTLGEGADPVQHALNHWFYGETYWLWSAHIGTLLFSAVLTVWLVSYAAKRISTGPESEGNGRFLTKNPVAQLVEVIAVYLRENTVRPLLGARTDKFVPFIWTMFFFILINNILGLLPIIDTLHFLVPKWKEHEMAPIGGTATQNLYVTGALALIAALVINLAGIREIGIGGYLKHLTAGTPWWIAWLMIPIEMAGILIKPAALAIRLFANMTAGHILLAVLLGFVIEGLNLLLVKGGVSGVALGGTVTIASALGSVAIYFLELFVAVLQAFVFVFLTTVFISQLSHHGDHEHHGAHDHEHAHA